MKPKFKIDKHHTHYIDDAYICNGHWLIDKHRLQDYTGSNNFKQLKLAAALPVGTYGRGFADRYSDTPRKLEAVIPRHRDGYVPVGSEPIGVKFKPHTDEIIAYRYEGFKEVVEDKIPMKVRFEVGVQHKYVPILRMGYVFAKGSHDPILILSGNSINDDLVAVVMPIRM